MRIEKRFLAFGHDIDTDVTPLAAGLEFAIARNKDFVGREALSRLGDKPPRQRIATVVLDDAEAVPLGSEPVRLGERIVGKTTSASFGYRIGRPVALAMIDTDRLAGASEPRVDIDIAGGCASGVVRFGAAYDPRGTRMRPMMG